MRWEALFADLEAQADRLSSAERGSEVEEQTRVEVGRLALVDRLRPSVGLHLQVRCGDGLAVSGTLLRVGPEWLLLAEGGGHEVVVALRAVSTVAGASRLSAPPRSMSIVESRLGLRQVLRGVARDRSGVRVHLVDGTVLYGTIDRVGADLCEMAVHPVGEQRRRTQIRDVVILALPALVAVRRDG